MFTVALVRIAIGTLAHTQAKGVLPHPCNTFGVTSLMLVADWLAAA